MTRTFSGLVVLLPDLDPVVGPWRQRYDADYAGLPAHVTVLTPWIAPDDITDADLDAVGQLVKSWQPFDVSFGAFGQFENGEDLDVHYLAPEPVDPFLGLIDDLCTVWPEYQPYGGVFDDVIPHLTVSTSAGDEQAAELRARIEAALPVRTVATELSVVEIRADRYQLRRSFRLGGKKGARKRGGKPTSAS